MMDKVEMNVHSGFAPVVDATYAFGADIGGQVVDGASGIHLSELLLRLVRRKGVWKGKNLKAEFTSLLTMISLHIESSLKHFKIIPLRQLPDVLGQGGQPRHVADLQRKEEMLQLASRVGAALTASRLTTAIRAYVQDDQPAASPGQQGGEGEGQAAAPPGGAFQYAGKHGACGYFAHLRVIPVIAPVTRGPSRDQQDYEGMVMQQYSYSLLTGFPPGCLHLATDGVQAKTSGEINQYFVLAPTRPSGGVIEVVAWLPIQVKRDA